MKLLAIAASLLLATTTNDVLTGRWETPVSEKGNTTGIVFKGSNLMEAYINKKPFVSGKYFFNAADSVVSFVDNGCNNVTAVYKVQLFSNSDSMRFTPIMDNCTERLHGMIRLVMGRVK